MGPAEKTASSCALNTSCLLALPGKNLDRAVSLTHALVGDGDLLDLVP